ncbi:MAG: hypothetical protein DLD55_06290 [candidate division SR1 bacterium]|nr:MAG: hypothetical protein DLD55_06290 [candidate division SR1 bacterium]
MCGLFLSIFCWFQIKEVLVPYFPEFTFFQYESSSFSLKNQPILVKREEIEYEEVIFTDEFDWNSSF